MLQHVKMKLSNHTQYTTMSDEFAQILSTIDTKYRNESVDGPAYEYFKISSSEDLMNQKHCARAD